MAKKIEISEETVVRRRGVARLARLVGRDHSHITRVLSGERKPGRDLARKLARLGVRPEKEAVVIGSDGKVAGIAAHARKEAV
jgi:transcriptional regulator with XRE-family HTH domain